MYIFIFVKVLFSLILILVFHNVFDNIFFIGGIHGSGKGNIAQQILSVTNLIHLEASKVLKWEEISLKENKYVEDINITQNSLIKNLHQIVDRNKRYLLDGHYCLIKNQEQVERIDIETFEKINPISLSIKIDDPQLEHRDSKIYDINFLEHFQNEEIKYAQFLSQHLKKTLFILNDNLEKLIIHINHENPS